MPDYGPPLLERIAPLLMAIDTFRTLATATEGNASWKRSAYDNLMRELSKFQETEEGRWIEEVKGLLREVCEELGEGNDLARKIQEALGTLSVPPG